MYDYLEWFPECLDNLRLILNIKFMVLHFMPWRMFLKVLDWL